MTDTTALLVLAERVEKAEGADRGLDAEIAAALCGGRVDVVGRYWKPGVRGFCVAPSFTASLDAAMTLYVQIPERIPSDPRKATAEALRQRAAS